MVGFLRHLCNLFILAGVPVLGVQIRPYSRTASSHLQFPGVLGHHLSSPRFSAVSLKDDLRNCTGSSFCNKSPPPCTTAACNLGYPCDCARYVHCVMATPNIDTLMSCPIGMQWSARIKGCDRPQNAQCAAVPPVAPVNYGSSIGNGMNATFGLNCDVDNAPPLPPHATWMNPTAATLQFQCEDGYLPTGSDSVVCNAGTGIWNIIGGTLGSCAPDLATVTTITSHTVVDHLLSLSYHVAPSSHLQSQPQGTVEIYSQQYGGTIGFGSLDLNGDGNYQFNLPYGSYQLEVIYESNSDFLNSEDRLNVTVQANCSGAPSVTSPFTTGNCVGNVIGGTTCSLSCINNYIPLGSFSVTCSNGQWSTPLCFCIAKCANLPSFTSPVTVGNCTTNALQGTTCILGCPDPYVITNGNFAVTCGSNGQWSTSTGSCKAKCANLPTVVTPFNVGTCGIYNVLEGSTCSLGCNEGYYSSGSLSVTCGSTGLWSNPTGSCLYMSPAPVRVPINGNPPGVPRTPCCNRQ